MPTHKRRKKALDPGLLRSLDLKKPLAQLRRETGLGNDLSIDDLRPRFDERRQQADLFEQRRRNLGFDLLFDGMPATNSSARSNAPAR